MWWKSGKLDPVSIDFRLLPIKMADHTVEAGFFAKRRGFPISPPFKKVEQVKKLFPDAFLTKKAQEEVKLSDLFAVVPSNFLSKENYYDASRTDQRAQSKDRKTQRKWA